MPSKIIAATCAAAVIVLAAVSSPASSAPSGASVVAKITQAYGGRAVLDSIKTQVDVVSLTLMGQASTITSTREAPDKFLEVVSIPAARVTVTTGYDGKTAWQRDSYGHVQALSGDRLAAELCKAHDPMTALLYPALGKAAFAVQPNATIDGKAYIVLLVSQPGCPSTTLDVDPKTYLVSRLSNDLQTADFSDYVKGAAGEVYPKTVAITTPEGSALATLTSHQDNVPVDESMFAMPSASTPSSSPSAAGESTPSPAPSPSSMPATAAPSPTPTRLR